MGPQSVDNMPVKHLFLKALILSFLGHGAVMSLFIFVFPLYQSPLTPKVHFIGSSLSQHDFSPYHLSHDSTPNKLPSINLLKTTSNNNNAPFPGRNNTKPHVTTSLDPDSKTTIKATFLEENNATNTAQSVNNKEPIYKSKSYVPLKLNQQ